MNWKQTNICGFSCATLVHSRTGGRSREITAQNSRVSRHHNNQHHEDAFTRQPSLQDARNKGLVHVVEVPGADSGQSQHRGRSTFLASAKHYTAYPPDLLPACRRCKRPLGPDVHGPCQAVICFLTLHENRKGGAREPKASHRVLPLYGPTSLSKAFWSLVITISN